MLIGVSYSGFGVATLASHHPEIHPDRLIVIDSFLDLVARRHALPPTHETAKEIDLETGGSDDALRQRSVSLDGLAQLVRQGTQLTVIWSISPSEQREFGGATCNQTANAGVLMQLASTLQRPVVGWVTQSKHGYDLWNRGRAIIAGKIPGRAVTFQPDAPLPPGRPASRFLRPRAQVRFLPTHGLPFQRSFLQTWSSRPTSRSKRSL